MNETLKKIISGVTLAAVALSVTGCVINANNDEMESAYIAESKPAEVVQIEEIPEEPEKVYGTAAVSGIGLLCSSSVKGTDISITGEQNGYYIFDFNGSPAYIEQRFVRTETEEPFISFEAEILQDAGVYDNVYLESDPVSLLPAGTAVTVADEFGGVQYVEGDGIKGYIMTGSAAAPAEEETKTGKMVTGKKSSSGGSSSSAASSVTEQTPVAPDASEDGGAIDMSGLEGCVQSDYLMYMASVPEEDEEPSALTVEFSPCTGTVLGDGAEIYSGFTADGETYEVTEITDDTVSVIADGIQCTLPRWAVLMEGESMPQPAVKYVTADNNPYYDYKFRNPAAQIDYGSEVSVILERDDMTVLTASDGITYYLKSEQSDVLSDTVPEPETTENEDSDNSKSSGKSSGSSGGKSSGKSSSAAAPEESSGGTYEIPAEDDLWTDEAL